MELVAGVVAAAVEVDAVVEAVELVVVVFWTIFSTLYLIFPFSGVVAVGSTEGVATAVSSVVTAAASSDATVLMPNRVLLMRSRLTG